MTQQTNVLDAVNQLFAGLEVSQKKGLYSFEESAKLYGSMVVVKQYFKNVVEQQQKAQAQQQAVQQKAQQVQQQKAKLASITEEL